MHSTLIVVLLAAILVNHLLGCSLLLSVLIGRFELVLVEEVDQVLLAGLQSHLACELMDA